MIQHAFNKLSTFLRYQQCWTTCSNAPNIWFNKALNASWSKCWNRLNGPLPMLKKVTNILWLFFSNCWRFSHLTQNELKEPWWSEHSVFYIDLYKVVTSKRVLSYTLCQSDFPVGCRWENVFISYLSSPIHMFISLLPILFPFGEGVCQIISDPEGFHLWIYVKI